MTDVKKFGEHAIGKIIQLDYDLITSLTGECTYCLTDGQVQMILGVLDYFGWATRWYSASGTVDQQTILDLQGGLGSALMNGCCPDNSILYRWSPDGVYQKSIDGGATWQDAPEDDPRNPQPTYPPILPPDTVEPDCTYADSVVNIIKGFVDGLSEDSTYTEILSILNSVMFTLFAALSPTIIGSFVVGFFGAIINIIIIATIPAFQAAMSTDTYNRFRCNLRAHMGTDGAFTPEQVTAVYNQLAIDETGMALTFLQAFVSSCGATGLTNAARSGAGAADADCSSCDDFCGTDWIVTDDRITGLTWDGTTKTIAGDAVLIAGNYYWSVKVAYPACCAVSFAIDTGAVDFKFFAPCDYTGELTLDESTGWVSAPLGLSGDYRGVLLRSPVPFHGTLHFAT